MLRYFNIQHRVNRYFRGVQSGQGATHGHDWERHGAKFVFFLSYFNEGQMRSNWVFTLQ